jgi:hypothetical protein
LAGVTKVVTPAPDPVPDEGNLFVIRLWNRVGLYRTLAVLLLVGAVAGGVAVAADRPTQQPKAAEAAAPDVGPIDPEALARQDAERAAAERAARDEAQRKANEAAVAAAEQAKKPSNKPSTKPSTSPGKPGKPVPAGPASCAVGNFKNPNAANKSTGCRLLAEFGFGLDQMGCLEQLWIKESQWNPNAHNSGSGAHGIPQSLPASKMAKFGSDYMTNPATQIRWGLDYIKGRYGNPCGAWGHSQRTGWY